MNRRKFLQNSGALCALQPFPSLLNSAATGNAESAPLSLKRTRIAAESPLAEIDLSPAGTSTDAQLYEQALLVG
jgi:hypothetical protein